MKKNIILVYFNINKYYSLNFMFLVSLIGCYYTKYEIGIRYGSYASIVILAFFFLKCGKP